MTFVELKTHLTSFFAKLAFPKCQAIQNIFLKWGWENSGIKKYTNDIKLTKSKKCQNEHTIGKNSSLVL